MEKTRALVLTGATVTLEKEGANFAINDRELVIVSDPGRPPVHVFSLDADELAHLRDWLVASVPADLP